MSAGATAPAPIRTRRRLRRAGVAGETGLTADQIEQLLIKTRTAGGDRADARRSPAAAVHDSRTADRAGPRRTAGRVRGATGSGAVGYRYALTDAGRDRARQYFDASQYVGPAPASRCRYVAQMPALAAARGYVDREAPSGRAFPTSSSAMMLEQLGPALNAGKAVFLYGPPGNGKTVIAEGLGRTLGGDMYMPHAIDVDGHTMTMFDPISYSRWKPTCQASPSVILIDPRDRRWVRIRRPVVMVGGELTLDMLDLTFNPIAKFYEAPIQLKANGGVFLVDDFGRQRIRPQDLLNRWIVPLESRVDYLTLHTGKKFQVPFDVLIVFATNLDPGVAGRRSVPAAHSLQDSDHRSDARRVHADLRVELPPPEPAVPPGDGGVPAAASLRPAGRPLRACHPRDLLDQVTALCRLSRHRAGDHARAARRGLRVVCSSEQTSSRARDRYDARHGKARQPSLAWRRRWRNPQGWVHATVLTDLLARAMVGALFTMLSINLFADFMRTGRVTGLLLLAGESLVVVLTKSAPPRDHGRSLGGRRDHNDSLAGRPRAAARGQADAAGARRHHRDVVRRRPRARGGRQDGARPQLRRRARQSRRRRARPFITLVRHPILYRLP